MHNREPAAQGVLQRILTNEREVRGRLDAAEQEAQRRLSEARSEAASLIEAAESEAAQEAERLRQAALERGEATRAEEDAAFTREAADLERKVAAQHDSAVDHVVAWVLHDEPPETGA